MTTIREVESTIRELLPSCWSPLEACLSLIGATQLSDLDHCIGLILVGAPGGRKSTTIELLGDSAPFVITHRFTSASFVSHSATATEEDLREIDLLPRIQHKIILIPELAPIFSQRIEDLTNDIGVLTAVMDGRGYQSDSGTHGHRGYSGDFRFGMIAGTTPIQHRDWQALGRLSSRWIFYDIGDDTGEIELRSNFRSRKERCKEVVRSFLQSFWNGYARTEWDRENDSILHTNALASNARMVARWRGLILRQDSAGYNPPIIETPNRMAETLYALTRGHALLRGNTRITGYDERFIANLNLTNMPRDRVLILDDLFNSDEIDETYGITQADAMRILGCSNSRAQGVLNDLSELGVIYRDQGLYLRT